MLTSRVGQPAALSGGEPFEERCGLGRGDFVGGCARCRVQPQWGQPFRRCDATPGGRAFGIGEGDDVVEQRRVYEPVERTYREPVRACVGGGGAVVREIWPYKPVAHSSARR